MGKEQPEITVRKMRSEDIPIVAELEKELFSDAWSPGGIEETIRQNHTLCLVAEKNEKIAGYLLVYYVMDECEIARIGVSAKLRRQGAGGLLICRLERFCRENGITRILLDVRESNLGARRFYQYCGFCEDGQRKNFYCDPQ